MILHLLRMRRNVNRNVFNARKNVSATAYPSFPGVLVGWLWQLKLYPPSFNLPRIEDPLTPHIVLREPPNMSLFDLVIHSY